ncbi:MAG: DNRLRE domain-containing protein [Euryarchaeota archaeon]|nr:DNRLRE domain-containing protein [Euryarchaeota archaeon]
MKTIISILLLISALCGVGTAQTYNVVLCPTDDAYIDSENPTNNYGGTGSLYVGNNIWNSDSDPNEYRRSYLKFDLSQIPVEPNITTTITSANLKLYSSIYGQSVRVGAYQCSNSWSETTIIWNSTPTVDPAPLDAILVVHDDTWYSWDATGSIQDSINDNISLMLKSERTEYGTERLSFNSKEHYSEELCPKLEITYTLSCSGSGTHINITDSDSDGVIDILDWDNSTPSGYWTDSHGRGRMWGDLDGDGELTSADALMILQAAAGAIKL